MSDYYNILGISKSASDDEIKNSYRKLARTHHPDKGGDKDKFQKIQEAYETLSDPNKRHNYDNPGGNFGPSMFPFEFNHNSFFRQHQEPQITKKTIIFIIVI
jgi:DnaJ-class molecular chaperone